ncbi:MAG: NADP-dependent phosphogluconate dehydrogenase [Gemmatimonadota bacterium]|nr:MAG: NADP-dependent phosphogluconate dehydrogenase [Gemmatimonadota bacterium]
MKKHDIGIIGMGVMGRNLALNMERNGFSVVGLDVSCEQLRVSEEKFSGKKISVTNALEEFLQLLDTPKKILLMVPAGDPVDTVIGQLQPHLNEGDLIIDGGNSHFKDTDRRGMELDAVGLHFIGAGISGGEEGALWGPSIMPGGRKEGYELVKPILTRIAAQVDDGPCCAYIGPGGAGHYVKMVHNAIEYGIMQLICETYDILKIAFKMKADEVQDIYCTWNDGELNCFLMEVTAAVLGKVDDETNQPVVDVILDQAGQKGTGKWASQNAFDLGVAIPTVNAAVEARILSAFKKERVEASRVLHGPPIQFKEKKEEFIESLRCAMKLTMVTAYAQGFALMREASTEYSFDLQFAEIARIWKGGCIIRARLLDSIREAFKEDHELVNLLISPHFASMVNELQKDLRYAVRTANELGIPCLAFSASLGYIDSYRQERLPANLLQAQRDCFGAHTYRRIDKEGVFHTEWQERMK